MLMNKEEIKREVNNYIRGTAFQISKKPEKMDFYIESNYTSVEEYISLEHFTTLVKAKYAMLMIELF